MRRILITLWMSLWSFWPIVSQALSVDLSIQGRAELLPVNWTTSARMVWGPNDQVFLQVRAEVPDQVHLNVLDAGLARLETMNDGRQVLFISLRAPSETVPIRIFRSPEDREGTTAALVVKVIAVTTSVAISPQCGGLRVERIEGNGGGPLYLGIICRRGPNGLSVQARTSEEFAPEVQYAFVPYMDAFERKTLASWRWQSKLAEQASVYRLMGGGPAVDPHTPASETLGRSVERRSRWRRLMSDSTWSVGAYLAEASGAGVDLRGSILHGYRFLRSEFLLRARQDLLQLQPGLDLPIASVQPGIFVDAVYRGTSTYWISGIRAKAQFPWFRIGVGEVLAAAGLGERGYGLIGLDLPLARQTWRAFSYYRFAQPTSSPYAEHWVFGVRGEY